MRIKSEIYRHLVLDIPLPPPEFGGLLGGNGEIITAYALDDTRNTSVHGYYSPNTMKLNTIISDWADKKIEFYGLFHTHFPYGYSLSQEDKQYINSIMNAMPTGIKYLYFPIIVPGDGMAAFKAVRKTKVVCIEPDTITLI